MIHVPGLLAVWLAACSLVLATAIGVVVVAALRSAARLPQLPRPQSRKISDTARKTAHTAARIPAPRQPPAALADTIRAELGALGCTCSNRPKDQP